MEIGIPDPKIDYANHPGFQGMGAGSAVDAARCVEIFEEIDGRFSSLAFKPKKQSHSSLEKEFRNSLLNSIGELKQIVRDTMKDEDLFRDSTCVALDNLWATLGRELKFRKETWSYRSRKVAPRVDRIVENLRNEGISFHQIPASAIAMIWDSLLEHRTDLEERKRSRPRGMASCVKPLPLSGAYFDVLVRELRQLGIIDAVNEYSRYTMDLDYCALHLAHEYEDWYRDCYIDAGIPTQRATYMHLDQDFALMKAMVYLRDFDESIGTLAPFSLIKTEHLKNWSYSQRAFFKELDYANGAVVAKDPGSETTYYRRLFRFPKFRKEFLKIPAPLQGSSHFGDDVLDSTEFSKYLLKRETRMTSDVANCALFTGGHNVHRGGMVSKGERWAFQVGFRARDNSARATASRWRRKIAPYTPTFAKKIYRTFKPRST